MPKAAKDHQQKSKPYSRSKTTSAKPIGSSSSSGGSGTGSKRSKPTMRSNKLKNEALANQLDDLMDDLTPHLINKKKQKHKKTDKAGPTENDRLALEEAQREYERVNNDMEDALGLLTKL